MISLRFSLKKTLILASVFIGFGLIYEVTAKLDDKPILKSETSKQQPKADTTKQSVSKTSVNDQAEVINQYNQLVKQSGVDYQYDTQQSPATTVEDLQNNLSSAEAAVSKNDSNFNAQLNQESISQLKSHIADDQKDYQADEAKAAQDKQKYGVGENGFQTEKTSSGGTIMTSTPTAYSTDQKNAATAKTQLAETQDMLKFKAYQGLLQDAQTIQTDDQQKSNTALSSAYSQLDQSINQTENEQRKTLEQNERALKQTQNADQKASLKENINYFQQSIKTDQNIETVNKAYSQDALSSKGYQESQGKAVVDAYNKTLTSQTSAAYKTMQGYTNFVNSLGGGSEKSYEQEMLQSIGPILNNKNLSMFQLGAALKPYLPKMQQYLDQFASGQKIEGSNFQNQTYVQLNQYVKAMQTLSNNADTYNQIQGLVKTKGYVAAAAQAQQNAKSALVKTNSNLGPVSNESNQQAYQTISSLQKSVESDIDNTTSTLTDIGHGTNVYLGASALISKPLTGQSTQDYANFLSSNFGVDNGSSASYSFKDDTMSILKQAQAGYAKDSTQYNQIQQYENALNTISSNVMKSDPSFASTAQSIGLNAGSLSATSTFDSNAQAQLKAMNAAAQSTDATINQQSPEQLAQLAQQIKQSPGSMQSQSAIDQLSNTDSKTLKTMGAPTSKSLSSAENQIAGNAAENTALQNAFAAQQMYQSQGNKQMASKAQAYIQRLQSAVSSGNQAQAAKDEAAGKAYASIAAVMNLSGAIQKNIATTESQKTKSLKQLQGVAAELKSKYGIDVNARSFNSQKELQFLQSKMQTLGPGKSKTELSGLKSATAALGNFEALQNTYNQAGSVLNYYKQAQSMTRAFQSEIGKLSPALEKENPAKYQAIMSAVTSIKPSSISTVMGQLQSAPYTAGTLAGLYENIGGVYKAANAVQGKYVNTASQGQPLSDVSGTLAQSLDDFGNSIKQTPLTKAYESMGVDGKAYGTLNTLESQQATYQEVGSNQGSSDVMNLESQIGNAITSNNASAISMDESKAKSYSSSAYNASNVMGQLTNSAQSVNNLYNMALAAAGDTTQLGSALKHMAPSASSIATLYCQMGQGPAGGCSGIPKKQFTATQEKDINTYLSSAYKVEAGMNAELRAFTETQAYENTSYENSQTGAQAKLTAQGVDGILPGSHGGDLTTTADQNFSATDGLLSNDAATRDSTLKNLVAGNANQVNEVSTLVNEIKDDQDGVQDNSEQASTLNSQLGATNTSIAGVPGTDADPTINDSTYISELAKLDPKDFKSNMSAAQVESVVAKNPSIVSSNNTSNQLDFAQLLEKDDPAQFKPGMNDSQIEAELSKNPNISTGVTNKILAAYDNDPSHPVDMFLQELKAKNPSLYSEFDNVLGQSTTQNNQTLTAYYGKLDTNNPSGKGTNAATKAEETQLSKLGQMSNQSPTTVQDASLISTVNANTVSKFSNSLDTNQAGSQASLKAAENFSQNYALIANPVQNVSKNSNSQSQQYTQQQEAKLKSLEAQEAKLTQKLQKDNPNLTKAQIQQAIEADANKVSGAKQQQNQNEQSTAKEVSQYNQQNKNVMDVKNDKAIEALAAKIQAQVNTFDHSGKYIDEKASQGMSQYGMDGLFAPAFLELKGAPGAASAVSNGTLLKSPYDNMTEKQVQDLKNFYKPAEPEVESEGGIKQSVTSEENTTQISTGDKNVSGSDSAQNSQAKTTLNNEYGEQAVESEEAQADPDAESVVKDIEKSGENQSAEEETLEALSGG